MTDDTTIKLRAVSGVASVGEVAMSENLQRLIDLLYKGAPLQERITESIGMISLMCSEGRPPKMSIPVQWYDEDFYISETLKQAGRHIADFETKLAEAQRREALLRAVAEAAHEAIELMTFPELDGRTMVYMDARQAAIDSGAMEGE